MLPSLRVALLLVAYLLLSTAAARPDGTATPAQPATTTTNCVRFHKTGFWDVDIDNGPDLAPECGPPLSFYAIRNKARLPAEICAVVGAYLFFVLALATLLFTWGRRMRQSALGSNGTLEIEMVNSPKKQFEPSPVSPASTSRSWIKKGVSSLKSFGGHSTRNSRAGSNPASPGIASINSFDANVLEDDRDKAQKEMERLYAAVMAHDEAKKSQPQIQETEMAQPTTAQEQEQGQKPRMRVTISDTRLTIPPGPQTGNSQISEPTSPRSPIRAIYPPDHMFPSNYPQTPTSPIVARVPLENDLYPASPPPKSPPRMTFPENDPADPNPPASPRSILRRRERPGSQSGSSIGSSGSGSKTRKTIRNLRISQPMPADLDLEESQPLTPRAYPNPGQPPQPPTPHTGATLESTVSSDYQYESLDQPAPLPKPQPQRKPSNLTLPSNNSNTSLGSNGNGNDNGNGNKSASSSTNTLPFRAFQQTAGITSPGATKTTFLDRHTDKIGRGPMTGRTPRTGVPMTPYSPYMPFTPITPITPRLVNKRERKELKKAQGKKVIIEEDAVKDKDEMWDM
jgi:hypothetical protein